jgi:aminopeptidase N
MTMHFHRHDGNRANLENLSRAECAERTATATAVHYTVHLDLTDVAVSDTFASTTTFNFTGVEGASTWVDLIAPEILSATLNGRPIDTTDYDGARLKLNNLAADNTLIVVARCEYSRTGEGLHKFTDPADNEIYLYSQFEIADARRVFACFDQPDQKATYDFIVDAIPNWKVFSNTFAEITDLGDNKRHTFARTEKMSTYITAFVAGDYYGVTDWYAGDFGTYPLGLYCRKSMAEFLEPEDMFLLTKQGFETFEREFGVGYPFGKYDQIIVPEFNAGAMENAGCVTFYEGVIYRSRATEHEREFRSNIILHEMAHMWFGNLVTMKWWDDLWLNESFAEWASYWANQLGTRYKEAWTSFLVDRKLWAYREDQLSGTHPISTDMVDLDAVEVNFDGISYAKGASTLRQLVAFVGEKDFLAGVTLYLQRNSWGNTELADLLSCLEETSGRDLSSFTDTWLKTSGVNMLRPEVEVDADGKYTKVTIAQEAPAEPAGLPAILRKHRMAIGLYNIVNGKLERTQRVELDIDGVSTSVTELIGVKQPDLLLLNDDDLTYSKTRLDERSLKTVVSHLSTLPDSLPRALLLTTAWDMTRDGDMSTTDFIALLKTSLTTESFIPIVQRTLMQARTAAQFYGAPSKVEGHLVTLADAYLEWARTLPVGSDAQFASAKNFVAIARTDEQIKLVKGLLDGSASIEGVEVDTDFRWLLLIRLASLGLIGETEIAKEEAADKSAAGQRSAATARASIPTKAAKDAAWKAIYSGELSNEILASTVGGFLHFDQRELLADYIDPYFAELPRVWSEMSNEFAQTITNGLFPAIHINEQTIATATKFLDTVEIPYGCQRLVREGRDSIERALKAQAADK